MSVATVGWGSVRVRTTLPRPSWSPWRCRRRLAAAAHARAARSPAARTTSRAARRSDVASLVRHGTLPPSLGADRRRLVRQVVDDQGTVVSPTSNVSGRPPRSRSAPAGGEPAVRTVTGVRTTTDPRTTGSGRCAPAGDGPVDGLRRHQPGVGHRDRADAARPAARRRARSCTALFGLLTWLVVGRTLRPVEAIRAEVAAISDVELGPTGPRAARRRRDRRARPHDERDAGPARGGQPPAARLRRRRVTRAAEPAHPAAHPARGRQAHPTPTTGHGLATDLLAGRRPRWSAWSATCCSSPVTTTGGRGSRQRPRRPRRRGAGGGRRGSGRQPGPVDTSRRLGCPVPRQPGPARRLVRNLLENAAARGVTGSR